MGDIVKEIEVAFQEFLNNYLGLIKELRFQNPLEIYTLFLCMLHNGYLSCNGKFLVWEENTFDNNLSIKERAKNKEYYYTLLKTQIFCGEAVCRHTNTTLIHILNAAGIASNGLCVGIWDPRIELDLSKPKRSYEESYDHARKFFGEKAAQNFALEAETFNGRLTIKKVLYNQGHLIVISEYGKKAYIFDATKPEKRLFVKDETRKNMLVTDFGFEVKYRPLQTYTCGLLWSNSPGKLLANPTLPIDEALSIADATIDVCRHNKSVLDDFRSENQPLYQAIDSGMKRVRELL